MKSTSFCWHDTSLHFHPNGQDWDIRLFHGCMRILRSIGFSIGSDPVVSNYKSLQKSHRYGEWKGCEFAANYYPNGFEVKFFQNIVIENKNGGRYDFSKGRKMPYLIRLRYELARNRISEFLKKHGIKEDATTEGLQGLDLIRFRIRESCHFRGGDPLVDWAPDQRFNGGRDGCDANGNLITPGSRKCFYDRTGHLSCGVVYYNLNNMWWVYCPEVRSVAAFELFDWQPNLPRRRRDPKKQSKRLELELSKKADAMEFERCILLRNELQKLKQNA